MHQIVRVEPAIPAFNITWKITSKCNYDCMYCRIEDHNPTAQHKSLKELQDIWMSIISKSAHLNLPYKVGISGGEPVSNKDFLPFIQWLKNRPEKIFLYLTTNGSASLAYYKRVAEIVDGLSFSLHSEHVHESKFFNTARELDKLMIRPEKSFHVNIMDEFWNQDRIPIYEDYLKKYDISYSVNSINYTHKTRNKPILQGNNDLRKS